MTEIQNLIALINTVLSQVCDSLQFTGEEKSRLKTSFWEIYIYQTAGKIDEKSSHFSDQEKYLDTDTNTGYMLDVFLKFIKIFIKNIKKDGQKTKVLDIVFNNFQLKSY